MKNVKLRTSVGIAEFKARLASYLRTVKSGIEIELLERGVPVARVGPTHKKYPLEIIPPRLDPKNLGKYRFSVRPKKSFDAVQLLVEDRHKK